MLASVLVSAVKYVLLHKHISALKRDMGMTPLLFWTQIGMLLVLLPWAWAANEILLGGWKYDDSWSIWTLLLFTSLLGGTRAYTQQLLLTVGSAIFLVFCNGAIQMLIMYISVPLFDVPMDWKMWLASAICVVASLIYAYGIASAKLDPKPTQVAGAEVEGGRSTAVQRTAARISNPAHFINLRNNKSNDVLVMANPSYQYGSI
jgi:hypothetical protein